MTVIVKMDGAAPGKPDKVLVRYRAEPVPAQLADATVSWTEARRLLDRELKRLRKNDALIRSKWGDKVFEDYDRYLSTCVTGFEKHYQSLAQYSLKRID